MYDHNGQEMLKNQDIGKLVDVWMTGIIQNGGFTKVWVALKTIFLPVVLIELFWFRKRLKQLPRSPTLLEKTLLFLGTSLSILNLPLEVSFESYINDKNVFHCKKFHIVRPRKQL